MSENPLRQLNKLGQSVWQDYIRRGEMLSGDLRRLIEQDGLSGMTSNPTIFEKAIAGGKDYDESIQKFVGQGLQGPPLFEALAVEDIQMACDAFRPTYDATQGADGFVSIEVSPTLAYDTEGTIQEARRLWKSVSRPNLLVKIPGTKEGLPAILQTLSEGININITLLFAVERYTEVAEAYVEALERRAKAGQSIDRIASVASFFVSRIDTVVDQQLNAKLQSASSTAEREKLEGLLAKAAIANAKDAYQKFKTIFSTARFEALRAKGTRVQRVLWASTSTKNRKYRDVLYVETLIGADTVNTMPPATIIAFRDHGQVRPTLEENVDQAYRELKSLAESGIDLKAVTRQLEHDGVENFAKDYEKLLTGLEEKRQKLREGTPDPMRAALGSLSAAVTNTLARLDKENFGRRLWDRDPGLWRSDPEHQRIIKNALGWLTITDEIREHLQLLMDMVDEVRRAGYRQAVLLGMGGSSLCPDVCRATFGTRPGYLKLEVLDSTVPATGSRIEAEADLPRTLFIVSSKSGGTTETMTFFEYFYARVRAVKGVNAGENFVAITDPGTSLEALAKEHNFRAVIGSEPDIGGRYSALSNFGMVPAALQGTDVRALLERAQRMVHACACCVPPQDNPGVMLGVILAEAARAGRDKITFVSSPGVATFADWAEQLIAESTGKEGKGLIPVAGEALGDPDKYGNDRLFACVALKGEAESEVERKLKALENAGHPLVRIMLSDALDLGQEFFRWEIATATAGALLGINAFDQPNVQESKDHTSWLLAEFRQSGRLPEQPAALTSDGIQLFAAAGQAPTANSLEGELTAFLRQARPGDYLALMAYIDRSREHEARLQAIRTRLRDALRLATTLGYGPRFLHSTGQLHKGGPNRGVFVQITADDSEDLAVPGEAYTFSVLKQAQALGDLQSLERHGRRVIRLHLGHEVQAGLERLEKVVESAMAEAQPATQRM